MKSPLWIVNISFLSLLIFSASLMYFFLPVAPRKTMLAPRYTAASSEELSYPNIARIYEYDPFNTYVKVEVPKPEETRELSLLPPTPPTAVAPPPRQELAPEFLPPLSVKLKGVFFNSDPLFSRITLASTKTNEEALYKIGDTVEDATLIQIGKNKAVFTRSNSQQEILFLTDDAALKDPAYLGHREWGLMVKPLGGLTFRIDGRLFKKRVQSVAKLLDLLDITTAFDDGKSVGCRIGQIGASSLGTALGLQFEDIVVHINGIPTANTNDRVKIYKNIAASGPNQRITVSLLRGGAPIQLTYTIYESEDSDEDEVVSEKGGEKRESVARVPAGTRLVGVPAHTQMAVRPQGSRKLVQRAINLQPTQGAASADYMRRDTKAMVDYGGRDALLQRRTT